MHRYNYVLFVPMYNEAETAVAALGNVLEMFGYGSYDGGKIRVVVVDDGSTDGTGGLLQYRFGSLITLLRSHSNLGNGAATRMALQYVVSMPEDEQPDFVIRIDGDGQHDPRYLPDMMRMFEANEADAIVCSRFLGGIRDGEAPVDRLDLNFKLSRLVGAVTGWPVTDARSGFFGYDWRKLRPIVWALRTEKYGIPMELILRFRHTHPEARYLEIAHGVKYFGVSRKLDARYAAETTSYKVARMSDAEKVFVETCRELNLSIPEI